MPDIWSGQHRLTDSTERNPTHLHSGAGDVPFPVLQAAEAAGVEGQQQRRTTPPPAGPRPISRSACYATAACDAIEHTPRYTVRMGVDQFVKETSNNRTDEYDGSPEGGARFVRSRVVASVSLATGRRGAYRSSLVPVALAIIRSQPIMITDTVMLHLPLTPDRYPKGSKPIRGLISSRSCANATERTSANYTSLNRAFAGACYSRRCLNPYPSVTPKMYGLLQITGYYSVTTTQKSAW